ncbi:hypothetical protein B0H13DRAFT_2264447 [Mycena leptocephala]|nr:hypothetical protein B0H13DRAFT_2264447 [Mycena leptocephala]
MQYTVDSQRFDSDWDAMIQLLLEMGVSLLLYGIYIPLFLLTIQLLSRRRKSPGVKLLIVISCIMAVLGTAQMVVTIAETVVQVRFVQQDVQAQVLNEHESISRFSVLAAIRACIIFINNLVTDFLFLYRCYVIWGFRKKIVIVPVLLMLFTFVTGIVGAAAQPLSVSDVRISGSLAVATNLFLTGFTAGRIIWIRNGASHVGLDTTVRNRYTTAIGIILESGAIYCLAAIFLVVTVSLDDPGIYDIGTGIEQQLINIIPTFTLVYVGLKNTDYSQSKERIPQVPSNHASSRSIAVPPSQPCEVLDIKPQASEKKYGECV